MSAQELIHNVYPSTDSSFVCIPAWSRRVERNGELARRIRNNVRHVSDAIRGEQALTMFPNFPPPGFVLLLAEVRLGPGDDIAAKIFRIVIGAGQVYDIQSH